MYQAHNAMVFNLHRASHILQNKYHGQEKKTQAWILAPGFTNSALNMLFNLFEPRFLHLQLEIIPTSLNYCDNQMKQCL